MYMRLVKMWTWKVDEIWEVLVIQSNVSVYVQWTTTCDLHRGIYTSCPAWCTSPRWTLCWWEHVISILSSVKGKVRRKSGNNCLEFFWSSCSKAAYCVEPFIQKQCGWLWQQLLNRFVTWLGYNYTEKHRLEEHLFVKINKSKEKLSTCDGCRDLQKSETLLIRERCVQSVGWGENKESMVM